VITPFPSNIIFLNQRRYPISIKDLTEIHHFKSLSDRKIEELESLRRLLQKSSFELILSTSFIFITQDAATPCDINVDRKSFHKSDIRATPMEANVFSGSRTNKVIHID